MTPPRAEKTGRDFEDFIAKKLDDHGIIYERQVDVGKSIYGTRRIVDFLVQLPDYPEGLVLQIKYQTSPGSVDEKYPYENACILANERPTAILLSGSGYKRGAVEWLKGRVEENPYLVTVLEEVGEFARFLRKST